MVKRKTTEEFIQQAIAVHQGKYDYSQSEYIDDRSKLKIICPIHGEFWQGAGKHLSGQGCVPCYRQKQHLSKKDTKEIFIEKAIAVHGRKYDYSKVKYKLSRVKVEIVCPEHGSFWQTPNHHVSKKSTCPCCAHTARKSKLRLPLSNFISKAEEIHSNKYDYSKATYINSHTKIQIVCPIHGSFWQEPNSHLNGRGCDKCGGTHEISKEDAIKRAHIVHNGKYDYSKVVFSTVTDIVKIGCPYHGFFQQQIKSHYRGCGCPKCAEYGFNPRLSSAIYFLKIQTAIATFWKIGITNRTIKDRFRKDYGFIQSGWIWHGEGDVIWETEQELLQQCQGYKLNYLFPLLHNGGNSECFTLDLPAKKIAKVISQKLQSPPEIFQRTE